MTGFSDLPPELLTLVFEQLGGRELRRNASNLTVCRKWFDACHATYPSGLGVSDLRICGCDIEDFASQVRDPDQRFLMHRNTRSVRIRLLGHWWDQNTKPYVGECFEEGLDLDDDIPYNEPAIDFSRGEGYRTLMRWTNNVLNPTLGDFFADLADFRVLEWFTLVSIFDRTEDIGPQRAYLKSSSIAACLRNLPITHDLKNLTLDLCSGLDYDETDDARICEEVAAILPCVQSVRLRLKLICPDVFGLQPNLHSSDVKLKSLVVQLHQPQFPASGNPTATCCSPMEGSQVYLHEYMIRAASHFLTAISSIRTSERQSDSDLSNHSGRNAGPEVPQGHGLHLFRISYVTGMYPMISAVDCLTMRTRYLPEEFFAYEDEGSPCWFELQDRRLRDGGPFEFTQANG